MSAALVKLDQEIPFQDLQIRMFRDFFLI